MLSLTLTEPPAIPHAASRRRVGGRACLRILAGAMLVLLSSLLPGCAGRQYDQPLEMALNREADLAWRRAALKQADAEQTDASRDAYIAALMQLAWSDRHPYDLRRMAIDRLLATDEAAFLASADRSLVTVDHLPTLTYLCERAAQEKLQPFVPIAIESWARPAAAVSDANRPERRAIQKLRPDQAVVDVLREVLSGAEPEATVSHRVAAWTVLRRVDDQAALRSWLITLEPDSPLVADLQAAAVVLDELPANREGVLWLMAVRAMDDGAWWQRAASFASKLTPAQRKGLALRHLPILPRARPSELASSREQLYAIAKQAIGARPQVVRGEHAGTFDEADVVDEALAAHEQTLCWGDLLVMARLLRAMEDPAFTRALFVQADADLRDTTTEHGGVLVFAGQSVMPELHMPQIRQHDRKFYAPPVLISRMYTQLAHYHFHAHSHDNAAYAGPGKGDLKLADHIGLSGVVVTFVDEDRLDLDYYQQGGVMVGLGLIARER